MSSKKKVTEFKRLYQSISLPARASLWFTVSSVVQKGVLFLTTPIFTRLLTKEEYGSVSLYGSWMVLLTILATLELPSGVFNKALIRYEGDKDGYTSSALGLSSFITIVCYFGYLLLRKALNPIVGLSTFQMSLMFLDIFFTNVGTIWIVRERFEYRYKNVVSISIAVNILATLLSILFVVKSKNGKDTARMVGLTTGHALAYVWILILLIKKGKKVVSKVYWKYSLDYNLPLIPHYLSQQVLSQADRIMIEWMCGKASTAVYSLSAQIAMTTTLLTNAIHASLMPWTFQKIKAGEIAQIGKRTLQIEGLIGCCTLVLSLFAPEIIYILGGSSYYEAIYVIPPIAMSVLFITLYSFFAYIEFYYEKTKMVMAASCMVALLNIILNRIFIERYGYIAAGYTTLFCYWIYAIIHYTLMLKVCKEKQIDNPYPGTKIWTLAAVFFLISFGVIPLYGYTGARYLLIFLLLTAVIGLGWRELKNRRKPA